MNIKPLRFNDKPPISYEEVVQKWRESSHDDVFSGHFLVSFVTNSYQIEGVNIDYNTTKEIFESETVSSYTGDLRNAFSVMNNKQTASYINACLAERKELSLDFIKEVHRLLLFGSMDAKRYHVNGERAGEFKHKDYCVGRLSVGSAPETVEEDLQELCDVIFSYRSAHKDPLKIATAFHCYFEVIHPFADGNGRVGRWIVNYLLVLEGHPPVLFRREDRSEYYTALESFDSSEDLESMYNYLKEQTVLSWPALRAL